MSRLMGLIVGEVVVAVDGRGGLVGGGQWMAGISIRLTVVGGYLAMNR